MKDPERDVEVVVFIPVAGVVPVQLQDEDEELPDGLLLRPYARELWLRAGSSLGSRLEARRLEAIFVRLERLEARS